MFWSLKDTDAPALILQDGVISYRRLAKMADDFATTLPRRGMLVMLYADCNVETVVAYIACLRHGHVVLMVNPRAKASTLQEMKRIYRPDAVYAPDAESKAWTLHLRGEEEAAPIGCHEQLAVLLSTSGSTGSPKLVRLSRENLQANAKSICHYLNLNEQERAISNLPFYYSYGLSILNSHLEAGAAIVLTNKPIIDGDFWKFCDEHGVTSLAGVPYTYEMLEALNFRQSPPKCLRTMTQAGGRLSPEMVHRYAEWCRTSGRRFYVMYGQTEATARMSYLPPEEALSRSSSIGIAIPGGEFCLLDEGGREITECDEPGELVYRGRNVCLGYAGNRNDLAMGDINQGELHTGDVATRDEAGFYYISGRLKRFLKIAGNRFGLDELEQLLRNEGIEAVCGGRDEKLCVALTNAAQVTATRLFLKENWHLLKNQYKVRVVPEIPRSSTGKILYQQLFEGFDSLP